VSLHAHDVRGADRATRVEPGQIDARSDLAAAVTAAGLRLETIMPTQRLEDAFLDLLEAPATTGPVA